jgi:hypothetical protein
MWNNPLVDCGRDARYWAPPHRTGRGHSRIRLPPWMFDGGAPVGPRVKDAWLWQPLVREPVDPIPPCAVLLTAPRQHAHPEHHDVVPEGRQGMETPAGSLSQFHR